jgi:hypothetical protein
VISLVASTPEVSPRFRSISTTSGRTAREIRTAAAPSAAVARTSKPFSARSRATPSRQIGWSSTTMTDTFALSDPVIVSPLLSSAP